MLPPIPPIYQSWGGARGDAITAFDSLSPQDRESLTDGAKRFLSMIPVSITPLPGYSGQYEPRGWNLRSPGKITLNPAPIRNPRHIRLHEALHAIDFMSGTTGTRGETNFPSSLINRYYIQGGLTPKDTLEPVEAFASAGEHGPEGIPVGLMHLFANIYNRKALAEAKWSYSHGR